MPKKSDAFTGIKLSEQPSSTGAGLDQRLFSPPPQRAVSKPKQSTEPQEVGKQGSSEVGKFSSQPGKREVGQLFDIDDKPYRKDSFLFTTEEFEALEDLKLELRRKYDLRATKNDLARFALHNLVEQYKRHKEGSFVVQRLKNKKER